MKKAIIIAALSVGLLAVSTMAFAETTGVTVTPATTSADMTTKIQCVGKAVADRESAIDSAMTTFTGATNAAYSARATALQSAYSQTTAVAVRAAVKTAWNAFTSSMKTARKAWQTARMSAWSTFRTAAKVCKAPGSVSDSGHSVSEASGN
jgi:hypothetical protein